MKNIKQEIPTTTTTTTPPRNTHLEEQDIGDNIIVVLFRTILYFTRTNYLGMNNKPFERRESNELNASTFSCIIPWYKA